MATAVAAFGVWVLRDNLRKRQQDKLRSASECRGETISSQHALTAWTQRVQDLWPGSRHSNSAAAPFNTDIGVVDLEGGGVARQSTKSDQSEVLPPYSRLLPSAKPITQVEDSLPGDLYLAVPPLIHHR